LILYDSIIIDGNNFARRALHAHENLSVTKESGKINTGMVFGFWEIVISLLDKIDANPRIYVAWDKGRNKRNLIYPLYKSSRDKKEVDPKKQKKKEAMSYSFKKQMILLNPILRASGVYQVYIPKEEADDVIGTMAKKLQKQGQRVLIASGDHDMFQLIDKNIDLYLARPKESVFWDISKFEKHYGIKPNKMIDVMALMGDTGDDIPSIKGIGETKALRIVKSNPNLVECILDDREFTVENASPSECNLVQEGKECVKLAHKLVKIDCDMAGINIIKPRKNLDKLEAIFEFLEFNTYLRKINWEIFIRIGGEAIAEGKSSK
jgi:DNA polymerase-1